MVYFMLLFFFLFQLDTGCECENRNKLRAFEMEMSCFIQERDACDVDERKSKS